MEKCKCAKLNYEGDHERFELQLEEIAGEIVFVEHKNTSHYGLSKNKENIVSTSIKLRGNPIEYFWNGSKLPVRCKDIIRIFYDEHTFSLIKAYEILNPQNTSEVLAREAKENSWFENNPF